MLYYPTTMLVFYVHDTIEHIRSMGVPYEAVERVVLEHWEHASDLDDTALMDYASASDLKSDLLNLINQQVSLT